MEQERDELIERAKAYVKTEMDVDPDELLRRIPSLRPHPAIEGEVKMNGELYDKIEMLPDGREIKFVQADGIGVQDTSLTTDDLKALALRAKAMDDIEERLNWVLKACTVDRDAHHELTQALSAISQLTGGEK